MERNALLMAAVYKHKQHNFMVRFRIYFPDGTNVVRFKYTKTKPEADLICRECGFIEAGSRSGSLSSREIVQARHDGLLSDADAFKLSGGKAVACYNLAKVLEVYRKAISVSHTPVAFEKAFSKATLVSKWLERHPVPTLSENDVRQYILDRREGRLQFKNMKTGFARAGVRPKTIKNELQIMAGIVDEAMKLGMVDTNVVKLVSVPVKTSKVRRALSKDEIDRVLDAAELNRHLMHGQICEFVMVALFTGFRRSELRTLTWEDIDFQSSRIVVQSKAIDGEPDFTPKSGEARSKSIPERLIPIIKSIPCNGRFLFGGDRPYNVDSISQAVRVVMKRAGLSGVSLHHCRHTYGSWLLRKTGGNLKYVQGEMGHLTLDTTKNYMHSVESDDPARTFDYD